MAFKKEMIINESVNKDIVYITLNTTVLTLTQIIIESIR